ncbi:MAG: hypothetical protein DRI01_10680 [Chloroflexi bacterium]|nr:MAG: hypothetical protein DRI01_10680 [Chloroflexota bacterium]
MREVTVRTKMGGITLGRIDSKGRLVYLAGTWYPTNDPNVLDRLLRKEVAEIIDDGGETYRRKLAEIIPETWLEEGI